MFKKLFRGSLFVTLLLILSVTLSGCDINLGDIIGGLKNTLGSVIGGIGNVIQAGVKVVKNVIEVVKPVVSSVTDAIAQFTGRTNTFGEKINNALDRASNAMDKVDEFGQRLKDTGENMRNTGNETDEEVEDETVADPIQEVDDDDATRLTNNTDTSETEEPEINWETTKRDSETEEPEINWETTKRNSDTDQQSDVKDGETGSRPLSESDGTKDDEEVGRSDDETGSKQLSESDGTKDDEEEVGRSDDEPLDIDEDLDEEDKTINNNLRQDIVNNVEKLSDDIDEAINILKEQPLFGDIDNSKVINRLIGMKRDINIIRTNPLSDDAKNQFKLLKSNLKSIKTQIDTRMSKGNDIREGLKVLMENAEDCVVSLTRSFMELED